MDISLKAENKKDDIISDLISLSLENNLLISKDAVEYILMHESKKNKILSILRKEKDKIVTQEEILKKIEEIEKEEEKRVEIIRASLYYPSKDYEVEIDRIWELNTDYEAKTTVQNFIDYFNDRYTKIRNLLLQRNGVRNVVTIERLKSNNLKHEEVTLIAIVREKKVFSNGFMRFVLEDQSDIITAIPREEIKHEAENVVEDDVLAFKGKVNSKGNFIIEEILYPDIPMPSIDGIPKLKSPLTAAFISDLHFGSKLLIKDVMNNFFKWLKSGDDLARRLKFLFILGDNVDGIGIYPEQINELEMTNIYDQYKAFEDFLLKLPEHIEVIVIPGNHDAVRLAEPQPALNERWLPEAVKLNNMHFETNPSFLKIGDGESSLKVLLYHGYSFNAVIDAVTEIRKTAREKPTVVMRELLRRRHLAPIYGSTLIAPKKVDVHVIDEIPDIFASGDLHSHDFSHYKGVTLISGSTWQSQTAFQDRVGHRANPGKLTIVDLNNREVYVKSLLEG